jgi:hypothetical protein
MLELRHYVLRGGRKGVGLAEGWLGLCLQLYTNFITGHNLQPRDSVHWQLQSYTALLVLIETTT